MPEGEQLNLGFTKGALPGRTQESLEVEQKKIAERLRIIREQEEERERELREKKEDQNPRYGH